MVTIPLHCPHCGSEALVREGHAPNGKQKYRCHASGRRSRENPTPNAYAEARRQELLHTIKNATVCLTSRAPLGSLGRPSPGGAKKWLSFLLSVPPCSPPDPEGATSITLEVDERWSFVLKKAHESWMWIALCRKTRQWLPTRLRDRSQKTSQRLWEAIAAAYRQGYCFTDFWAAYRAVIPEDSTQLWAKRPEKRPTSSAGITPCESRWPVVSA